MDDSSKRNKQQLNNNKELSARLMAVQAYYQIAHNDKPVRLVVKEYLDRGLHMDIDGEELVQPHCGLFKDILYNLDDRSAEIEAILNAHIKNKKSSSHVIEGISDSKIASHKSRVTKPSGDLKQYIKNLKISTPSSDGASVEVVSAENKDGDLGSAKGLEPKPENKVIEEPKTEKGIEPLLKAILFCGICELMVHQDVDTPLIIDDYLNITHAFYEKQQVSYVNAILDNVSSLLRD